MDKLLPYAKFVAAVVGGAATSGFVLFGGDTTWGKICVVLSAAATAVTVYAVKNAPLTSNLRRSSGLLRAAP